MLIDRIEQLISTGPPATVNIMLTDRSVIRSKDTNPAARITILSAAYDLFSTVPYDKLNMQSIAEKAGVSKALLFYHFRNKEELARESLILGLEREMEHLGTLIDAGEEQIPLILPRWLRMSTDSIQLIQTYMEIADLKDPEDPLNIALRDFYGKLIGFLESTLKNNRVRFPGEKAVLLTLIIDMFGLIGLVREEPLEIDRYVKAILDIMGMERKEKTGNPDDMG